MKKVAKEDYDLLESQLEPIFIFCLIWSVGCTGDYESREKFNLFFREFMKVVHSKV